MTARRARAATGMPLREHLRELRRRLAVSAAALVVAAVVVAFFSTTVIELLASPLHEIEGAAESAINFSSVTAAFDLRVRIAITGGIVLSSPVWLYQVWAFIVPALKRTERRYAIGFGVSVPPLFFAGAAAGAAVSPHIVQLMATFAPFGSTFLLQSDVYFDFVLKLVIVIGVAFVLPVFLVALNFAGVISGKDILKGWRVAILVITLFTATATPAADVLSMVILAVPLVGLYFGAVLIAVLHDRRAAKRLGFLLTDTDGAADASATGAQRHGAAG